MIYNIIFNIFGRIFLIISFNKNIFNYIQKNYSLFQFYIHHLLGNFISLNNYKNIYI